MKKLATFALASLAIVALAASAFAQPEAGDAGIFFDTAGTQSTGTVVAFVPTNFYVIGFGLGDISGWESSVTNLPAQGFLVLSATLNPSNALNVGSQGNFIVGLGVCATVGSGSYNLVSYQSGFFTPPPTPVPQNVAVCMGGTTPSTFGGAAGYSTCGGQLRTFGKAQNGGADYPDGCGVINATHTPPVGTETVSFGAVKAVY
jgi:hypothetical protein